MRRKYRERVLSTQNDDVEESMCNHSFIYMYNLVN